MKQRVICWFSRGSASAVALKRAVIKYGHRADIELRAINCNVKQDEHPDNERFERQVSKWVGWKIETLSSHFKTVDEVCEKTRYMSGPDGARCTLELKKKPRYKFQRPDDIHIFGYTSEEADRASNFAFNNPDLILEWNLIQAQITKDECHEIIESAGIRQPAMYRLGYKNNNCRGCLKSTSLGYWNKIRRDFPTFFKMRANRSRELGVKLIQITVKTPGQKKGKRERIFLDELDPNLGKYNGEDLSCGPACNSSRV